MPMPMPMPHPYRFAVQGRNATTAAEWQAKARRAESLGYHLLLLPDHFAGGLAPFPALAIAAAATTRLRIGTYVLANDFRHPALLAKEAATLDRLSDGRFQLGLGAGWQRAEYQATSIPFDPASTRIDRLAEAIDLLKRLFADGPASFAGDHYRVNDLEIGPKPIQQPHPPILVGGGGRRLLEVAARQADIVAFAPRARPDGTLEPASISAAATAEKAAWVQTAASPRPIAPERNVYVYAVEITHDPAAAAARLAADFDLPADELRASPHVLLGSVDAIVDLLHERRERYGITSITVGDHLIDALAPVVARLAT